MYEEYDERTQSMGVDFIRGKVAEGSEDRDGNPMLRFEDTLECEIREEPYDLVVLSTGMESNIDDNISRFGGLTLYYSIYRLFYRVRRNSRKTTKTICHSLLTFRVIASRRRGNLIANLEPAIVGLRNLA
mgnify:CR=1 FL=1